MSRRRKPKGSGNTGPYHPNNNGVNVMNEKEQIEQLRKQVNGLSEENKMLKASSNKGVVKKVSKFGTANEKTVSVQATCAIHEKGGPYFRGQMFNVTESRLPAIADLVNLKEDPKLTNEYKAAMVRSKKQREKFVKV